MGEYMFICSHHTIDKACNRSIRRDLITPLKIGKEDEQRGHRHRT